MSSVGVQRMRMTGTLPDCGHLTLHTLALPSHAASGTAVSVE